MYNGFLGGIGQGLSSFSSAYMTALNYQLEKAKAQALTDYQNKQAAAADQTATAASANAYTDMLNKLGGPAAFPNAKKLRMQVPSDVQNQDLDDMLDKMKAPDQDQANGPDPGPALPSQTANAAGLLSTAVNPGQPTPLSPGPGAPIPLPPGMVGPPAPGARGMVGPPAPPQPTQAARSPFEQGQGFIGPHLPITGQPASSAQMPPILPSLAKSPGLMAIPPKPNPFAPAQGLYGIFQPGQYPSEQTRQMALGNLKTVADKNLEGKGQVYGLNRQTLQPELISPSGGPLTPQAALELQKGGLESQNLQYGQRSTNQEAMNDFNQNPATIAAKKSAGPMNEMLKVLKEKNPYPTEIQNMLRNSLAVQFGTTDDKALNDIMSSQPVVDQLNSLIEQAKSGTPVKEIINGIAKTALNSHISKTQDMMIEQKKAMATLAAHQGDPNDPGIALDPATMKAYNGAMQAMAAMAKAGTSNAPPPPYQRPGASWKNGWGVFRTPTAPAAPPPHGPTVIQNGHTYNWNPQAQAYQ